MKINKNGESVPRLAASAKQAGVSSVFSESQLFVDNLEDGIFFL
jgi:hypothetical protein